MRKMRLDLEELTVESFATADALRPLGTVRGNVDDAVAITVPEPIVTPNCSADSACDTCRYSCIDSCTPQPTCDSCFVTRCRANCG
jgi:hypothetical protein